MKVSNATSSSLTGFYTQGVNGTAGDALPGSPTGREWSRDSEAFP